MTALENVYHFISDEMSHSLLETLNVDAISQTVLFNVALRLLVW